MKLSTHKLDCLTNEFYRTLETDEIMAVSIPDLFSAPIYKYLQVEVRRLLPQDRRIFVTMNEYKMTDINPQHSPTEPYSHLLVFCIKYVRSGRYQPFGSIVIPRDNPVEDQYKVLANSLKIYIHVLWKMGLYVLATVSPPTKTFKEIFKVITSLNNFDTYAGTIKYDVGPVKDIVHIYDLKFMLKIFMNTFKKHDIKLSDSSKIVTASWGDIWYALTVKPELKSLKRYFTSEHQEFYFKHIFGQRMLSCILDCHAKKALPSDSVGTAVLIDVFSTILKFIDLEVVDSKQMMSMLPTWRDAAEVISTIVFRREFIMCTPQEEEHVVDEKSQAGLQAPNPKTYKKSKQVQNVIQNVEKMADVTVARLADMKHEMIDDGMTMTEQFDFVKVCNSELKDDTANEEKLKLAELEKLREKEEIENFTYFVNAIAKETFGEALPFNVTFDRNTDLIGTEIEVMETNDELKKAPTPEEEISTINNLATAELNDILSYQNDYNIKTEQNSKLKSTNCDNMSNSTVAIPSLSATVPETIVAAIPGSSASIPDAAVVIPEPSAVTSETPVIMPDAPATVTEVLDSSPSIPNAAVVIPEPSVVISDPTIAIPNATTSVSDAAIAIIRSSAAITEKPVALSNLSVTNHEDAAEIPDVMPDLSVTDHEDAAFIPDSPAIPGVSTGKHDLTINVQFLADKSCAVKVTSEKSTHSSIFSATYEKHCMIDEWMVTINGLKMACEKLHEHQVRTFKTCCFNLEHIDYFIDMVKRMRNGITRTGYRGASYSLMDADMAYHAIECEPDGGCFMVL